MADIEINEEIPGGESSEELGEHEAAKAAGAAEVHQEDAEEAAAEAEAAAEVAIAAATANTENIGRAEEAAARAEESANAANSGAHAVAEAINAQTAVLQSLLDQMATPKESPTEDKEPVKKTPDKPPAASKKGRVARAYFGGRR